MTSRPGGIEGRRIGAAKARDRVAAGRALGSADGVPAGAVPPLMGKRARNRATPDGGSARSSAPRGAPIPAAPRKGLDPVRKALARSLVAALGLGIVTLLGIILLGGSLGPFVVLVVVAVAATLLFRRMNTRLAGMPLTDEDRVMQTLTGGLLAICVVLALSSAVLTAFA